MVEGVGVVRESGSLMMAHLDSGFLCLMCAFSETKIDCLIGAFSKIGLMGTASNGLHKCI